MADYTVQASGGWATKDALASGETLKKVSATELGVEFSAISVAVGTKADINGNSGEAYYATTAVASSNNTQVATTAYVAGELTLANINALVYPVGSIFISADSTADTASKVATLLGIGTWVAFGAGKVPVGFKNGDSDFGTIKGTGGRRDAVLPRHRHDNVANPLDNDAGRDGDSSSSSTGLEEYNKYGASTGYAGTTLAGNENLQPYITVYMWERTD